MLKCAFGEDSPEDQFRSSREVPISLWSVTSNSQRTWKWKMASPGPLILRPTSRVELVALLTHFQLPLQGATQHIWLHETEFLHWVQLVPAFFWSLVQNRISPGQSTCQGRACTRGLHNSEVVKQVLMAGSRYSPSLQLSGHSSGC